MRLIVILTTVTTTIQEDIIVTTTMTNNITSMITAILYILLYAKNKDKASLQYSTLVESQKLDILYGHSILIVLHSFKMN